MQEEIKVIVIDDDPMVSHLNRKYTEKVVGFKVINEVNIDNNMIINQDDLKEADLLLLDIYLPGQNGIDILKNIRESNHNKDVIIISASKEPQHISEAMQWGVVDYLIKPFTFDRFKKSLHEYKKRKNSLATEDGLDQKTIDSLMGKDENVNGTIDSIDDEYFDKKRDKNTREKESFIRDLPKGLNDVTLNNIKDFMRKEGEKFSTKDIAKNLGLARVTGQRYLKYMADEGIVEILREYGGVGRPKHYYKLTE
ncbi:response regulator [Selenihalanaerobacter shriftii]|uniref:Transcriptional regulatory protein n=1 Tax=Selenihalanaerobacter shriftii TaxID=142842 RepID=A0A1T4K1S3_9FIRM|nr:response regulator [Selenihalanaerobacter shriftii]SJZ36245.1 two-component system, CitB family, response regulator [Selenihalanaerobacter shriftii]